MSIYKVGERSFKSTQTHNTHYQRLDVPITPLAFMSTSAFAWTQLSETGGKTNYAKFHCDLYV